MSGMLDFGWLPGALGALCHGTATTMMLVVVVATFGTVLSIASRAGPCPAAFIWSLMALSIIPGHTALMRMPLAAYSSAALLVKPSTPCLAAW